MILCPFLPIRFKPLSSCLKVKLFQQKKIINEWVAEQMGDRLNDKHMSKSSLFKKNILGM